jgi:hypothetical protein
MAKKKRGRRRKLYKPSTLKEIRLNSNKRRYNKRYLMTRNYVLARDEFKCQLCGLTGVKLEVHHIQLYSKNVSLRRNRRNLISLCKNCHEDIRNKETFYKPIFQNKVSRNTRNYRRRKQDHEERMKKLREHQQLPNSFAEYEYLDPNKVTKQKYEEHYLRKTWRGMKYRTMNKNSKSYERYGGRGIKIYRGWLDFDTFREYVEKNLGERPQGCSIDRIDNDSHYQPGNIRWGTNEIQGQNRDTTVLDEATAAAIFILYHKFHLKQVRIAERLGLNSPTIVSNVTRFKTWQNITHEYLPIVKKKDIREKISIYKQEIKHQVQ